jgi:hypothetical protein
VTGEGQQQKGKANTHLLGCQDVVAIQPLQCLRDVINQLQDRRDSNISMHCESEHS